MKTIPAATLYKLDINAVDWTVDPVVVGDLVYSVPTYAAGKAFWSGIYLAPESWGIVPFNPRIGAKVYAIDWWAPVGKLAPGMYGVTLSRRTRGPSPTCRCSNRDSASRSRRRRGRWSPCRRVRRRGPVT